MQHRDAATDNDSPQSLTGDPFRDTLHALAEILADLLEARGGPNPLDGPRTQSNGPTRPAAKRRHRRAPPMPPVIKPSLPVSDENRQRARQALLRRGVAVRPKEET